MAAIQQTIDPLRAIPDTATVREQLARNREERELLRQLLKLASKAEQSEVVGRVAAEEGSQ